MNIIPFETMLQFRARREKAKQAPPRVDSTEDVAARIAASIDELKAEIKGLRADLKAYERRLTLKFAGMLTLAVVAIVTLVKVLPGAPL